MGVIVADKAWLLDAVPANWYSVFLGEHLEEGVGDTEPFHLPQDMGSTAAEYLDMGSIIAPDASVFASHTPHVMGPATSNYFFQNPDMANHLSAADQYLSCFDYSLSFSSPSPSLTPSHFSLFDSEEVNGEFESSDSLLVGLPSH